MGFPGVVRVLGPQELTKPLRELTAHLGTVDSEPMEPRPAGPELTSSCGCWRNRASPTTDTRRGLVGLPPEPSAPQGPPSPSQGLGSPQRTTSRAVPTSARAPARASPLSKHFGCAHSPRPRRPFPRYPSQAHLGLCRHTWPGLARALRYQ